VRYAYKKQYLWSSDIAYIVGLFASDGCLINDGRHLNITSKDIEIIDYVQQVLDVRAKATTKTGGFNTTAYHLSFGDVAFYDFLVKVGLTPAKSKTLGVLKIPDTYYFDFLRGEFDGDGCIRGFQDIRWADSHMFYIEFASASPAFMTYLQANNTRLAGTTSGSIHPDTRVAKLSYAKLDSIKLTAAMFHGGGVPSLSRKRTKLFGFIQQHETAIIARNARVP
jgi:hypothetical protein